MSKKKYSKKVMEDTVWKSESDQFPVWIVRRGKLTRPVGRPGSIQRLLRVVAEKIPFEALKQVERDHDDEELERNGVYFAHDSMGFVRYAGRGDVFDRLRHRKSQNPSELIYFSYYIIESKNHEREIETLLIRLAGPLLFLNTRKKRTDVDPGDIHDYEPGTLFYERQYKKGKIREG